MRVRQFFRVRTTIKQRVSLVQQREAFYHRLNAFVGHGAGGLIQKDVGREVPKYVVLIPVVSVLTYPILTAIDPKQFGGGYALMQEGK